MVCKCRVCRYRKYQVVIRGAMRSVTPHIKNDTDTVKKIIQCLPFHGDVAIHSIDEVITGKHIIK